MSSSNDQESAGLCANPQCTLGGTAPSTHKCPGCQKNIHAPCGKETDSVAFVLCPLCEGQQEEHPRQAKRGQPEQQQHDNSPPSKKPRNRLMAGRTLPEPSPMHVGTTLETRPEEALSKDTLLRYHDALASFMSYRDKREYKSCHPFPLSEICRITPTEVAAWMAWKAYGKENPLPTDNPTQLRSRTLRAYKLAITHFLPAHKSKQFWNELTMDGNPTKSNEVKQLFKMVREKEIQGLGRTELGASTRKRASRPVASATHPAVHTNTATTAAAAAAAPHPLHTSAPPAAAAATLPLHTSAPPSKEWLLLSLLLNQVNGLQCELYQAKQEIVALHAEHKRSHQELLGVLNQKLDNLQNGKINNHTTNDTTAAAGCTE